MKETLLKVVNIEVLHSDKANCDFKKVTFVGINIVGGREVKTNVQGTRNLWPTHEVTLQNGDKTIIKGDPEYGTIDMGDFFAGKVFRCDTTPYNLDGRNVNSWTGVVFDHENELVVAARNLRQNSAAPKFHNDETGMTEVFQLAAQTPAAIGSKGTPKLEVEQP